MKILLLNQNWFAEELRERGHEVLSIGLFEGVDVRFPTPLLHIDNILKDYCNGFTPDRIFWLDNSGTLMIEGLQECDIPLAFYSVDAHHHADVHSYSAHVADLTFVAHKDYIQDFNRTGISPIWLPLWAPNKPLAPQTKEFSACFVGNLDKRLHPERAAFFERLKQLHDLHLTQGDWREIFPKAEIIVNQSVKGDLNFRTFEAMSSGAMLLTEKTTNGLTDLFTDGIHLATYERGNPEDAAEVIRSLLSNRNKMLEIAKSGKEHVIKFHTSKNRAETIIPLLENLTKTKQKFRYLGAMLNYTILSQALGRRNLDIENRALTAALKAAEDSLKAGEVPESFHTYHIIVAALRYDLLNHSRAGMRLISQFSESFPDERALICARIRDLLNTGKVNEARKLALETSTHQPEVTFELADKVICEILEKADKTAEQGV